MGLPIEMMLFYWTGAVMWIGILAFLALTFFAVFLVAIKDIVKSIYVTAIVRGIDEDTWEEIKSAMKYLREKKKT